MRLNYEPLINVLASASARSVVDKSRAVAYDCCDCCELKGTMGVISNPCWLESETRIKGKAMQIELSKAEYQTLLGVLEIADWVLFAHHGDRPSDRRKYHDLEQKLFGYAEAFEFDNLIEYVEEHGEYFPTTEYEDHSPMQRFTDEFENHNFWTELVDRLATRDMLRELGQQAVEAMDSGEQFMAHQDYERRYNEEFEEQGLERLSIKE